jgi:hypothetical protein
MTQRLAVGCFFALATGCGASLHQVPSEQPHGVLQVRFEHASKDFLYEWRLSVDGQPAQTVDSGERIRLSPGAHTLALISIAHAYGLGSVEVRQAGGCVDLNCNTLQQQTERRTSIVEVAATPCEQRVDLGVEAKHAVVAWLRVTADNQCSIHVAGDANGRVP